MSEAAQIIGGHGLNVYSSGNKGSLAQMPDAHIHSEVVINPHLEIQMERGWNSRLIASRTMMEGGRAGIGYDSSVCKVTWLTR